MDCCLRCHRDRGRVLHLLPVCVIWERVDGAYYTTIIDASDSVVRQSIVICDGDRWRWVAWRPGGARYEAYRGAADTIQEAMQEAEVAVSLLDQQVASD